MNNATRVALVQIATVIALPIYWYWKDEQWKKNDKKDFEQSVLIDISML